MSTIEDATRASGDSKDQKGLKVLFGERLSSTLRDKGLSQADLSRLSGEARSKISAYATGEKMPSVETAITISRALGMSVEQLILGAAAVSQSQSQSAVYAHTVPILDIRLAAGAGAWSTEEIIDGHMVIDDELMRQINRTTTDGLFVAHVDGDSMEPLISDKAPVLIDSHDDRIREGVYAIQFGQDLRIKRLRPGGFGGIDLISENNVYPVERIEGPDLAQFKIIGRALYAWKKL
jgi:phage repressor protein C with HTH and peptisase S24 domain